MNEIKKIKLPELCQTCSHRIETNIPKLYEEICRVYKRKIPLSVSQRKVCDFYPGKKLKKEKSLSSFIPIDTSTSFNYPGYKLARIPFSNKRHEFKFTGDPEVQEIKQLRNLAYHLTRSIKKDPKSSGLMKSLLVSTEKLDKVVKNQNEKIGELSGSIATIFQELEKTVGEDRIQEVIGTFLVEYPKPTFYDWRIYYNKIDYCEQEIKELGTSVSRILVILDDIKSRLLKVEDKVNLTQNIRWIISIIGSLIIGGFSGWILIFLLGL